MRGWLIGGGGENEIGKWKLVTCLLAMENILFKKKDRHKKIY